MYLKVLYEDNHLIATIKPPGILSQADRTGDINIVDEVKKYLVKKYNKPGNAYLGLIHRLDRPVGGVMVFAKTSKAASRLSDQIRRKKMQKQYYCVIRSGLTPKEGRLENYLYKNRKENKVYVVKKHKKSKKAILKYSTLENNNNYSLLKVKLITGRAHQIRVQLAQKGFPIVGDRKYGKDFSHYTVALWSKSISLLHPVKKEEITFKANPENKGVFKKFNYGD